MEDLEQIKKLVSVIVYGLISLIIATIMLRIFFMMIGASTASTFVVFIYNTSEGFVATFRGIYPNMQVNGGQNVIEVYSAIALAFYIMLGYLISKSIHSIIELDAVKIVSNIIDACFKFAEAILITRFLFKLTGASTVSQFVRTLYEVSNIFYEPFRNILPAISINSLGIIFETSTLIAIIAIIVFDSVSEGILAYLNKTTKNKTPSQKTHVAHVQTQPSVVHVQTQQAQPVPQHITVQMPQQQPVYQQPPQYIPPTQYIDRRTIQVIAPSPQIPQHPNYPYAGQNDLEHQRPAHIQQLPGQQNQNFYNPFNGEPMAPRNADPRSGQS